MATVIDALVVELGLDPSKFTEGQRKITESMRRLEQTADTSARTINRPPQNLREQFGRLDEQLQNINLQLFRTGDISRRTGESVAAGAGAGAVGLKNMAEAGLAAYAALKTVNGVIGQIHDATERATALNWNTFFSGFQGGVKGLDTFAKAIHESTNVPQQQVWSGIQNAVQKAVTYKQYSGQWPQEFTELGRIASRSGVNIDFNLLEQGRIPEFFEQLRGAMHVNGGAQGPLIMAAMNAAGLSSFAPWVSLSRNQANAATKRAGESAVGEDVTKELGRLGEAARHTQNAFETLGEKIVESMSEHGLRSAIEGAGSLYNALGQDKKAVDELSVAVAAFAGGSALLLISGIGKLLTGMSLIGGLSTIFKRLFPGLAIGSGLSELGIFTPPIPHYGETEEDRLLKNAPGRRPGEQVTLGQILKGYLPWNWQSAAAQQPPPQQSSGGFWTTFGKWWRGENSVSGAVGMPGEIPTPGRARRNLEYGPRGAEGLPTQMPAGGDPKLWAAFRYISHSEGAEDNPYNSKHSLAPNYFTASGYTQFVKGTWQDAAKAGGVDLNKYPEALMAPPEEQFKAFSGFVNKYGFDKAIQHWGWGAGGSMSPAKIAQLRGIMANTSSTPLTSTGGGLIPSASAATPLRGGSLEVWGDSLGVGLQRHLGGGGYVHGGDSPETILKHIKEQPESHWKGLTVALSSGSNENQMGTVKDTIEYLQSKGARVIPVGYGPKFSEKNAQLRQIAQNAKVPVVSAEGVSPVEGIHPGLSGYTSMANKIRGLAGGVNTINHGDINIGDVHVHTPATNPKEIASDLHSSLVDEVNRNKMNISSANSGLF